MHPAAAPSAATWRLAVGSLRTAGQGQHGEQSAAGHRMHQSGPQVSGMILNILSRPLRRPRRRWVDNIRLDLQEVGCGYVDWIGLPQDRDRWRTLVSAVMNLRVP